MTDKTKTPPKKKNTRRKTELSLRKVKQTRVELFEAIGESLIAQIKGSPENAPASLLATGLKFLEVSNLSISEDEDVEAREVAVEELTNIVNLPFGTND